MDVFHDTEGFPVIGGDASVEELAERIGVAIARVVAAVRAEGAEDEDPNIDARVRRWLFRLELKQRTQCLALALSEHWELRSLEIARAVRQDAPWSFGQYQQFEPERARVHERS